MKVILLVLSAILICNADIEPQMNLLRFERIIFDFVNVMVPKYRQTTNDLWQTILAYSNKTFTDNWLLYQIPALVNEIASCYAVCKAGVDTEIWTLPQIVDQPGGSGPMFNASWSDLQVLGSKLFTVSSADQGVVTALTNLSTTVQIVLNAHNVSVDGLTIVIGLDEFDKIIASLKQVASANVELGKAMIAIGDLKNTDMVKKNAPIASQALNATFESLVNGGRAYDEISKAVNTFVDRLTKMDGTTDNKTNEFTLHLPLLYKSLKEVLAETVLMFHKAKNGFENLPSQFYGSYNTTIIPMQTKP